MLTTKQFSRINEEKTAKFEILYYPKRCWWMRYILMPALIGLGLLLVLLNVDYSAHSVHEQTTAIMKAYPVYLTATTRSIRSTNTRTEKRDDNILSISRRETTYGFCNSNCCKSTGPDSCIIKCEDGWVLDLKDELQKLQKKCGTKNYLTVVISGYAATNNILKRENLNGNFYIKNLTLENNYGIKIIENQAFNSPSMATLGTLKLIRHELMSKINGNTFSGLNSLTEFHITRTSFEGEGFLQPLAQSLQKLIIGTESSTSYDPTTWLRGDNFKSLLYVELSRSKFVHLRKETFEKLISVKELYLMSCDITSIADGTFDFIANTLETLDLRDNQLVTLDVNFLQTIHGTLRLELSANSWDCNCENYPLIEAFNNNPKIVYSTDDPPMCAAPPKDKKKLFTEIYLSLQVECTITTTTELATSETTSADFSTSSSSESTTPSDTEPDTPSTKPTDTTNATYPTPHTPKSTTPPSTKPTLPSTTTEDPMNFLTLQCKTHSLPSEDIKIRNYDALFSIATETQRSVKVTIDSDMSGLNLIYFMSKSNSYVNASHTNWVAAAQSRVEIVIQGLTPEQLYVFCLMPDDEPETSPLNCLSHIVKVVELPRYVWLSKDDLAWAVSVLIIGILLFVCCGVAAIYFLLRWRPTWLRGSKRIIRKKSSTFEVYLVPKESGGSKDREFEDAIYKLDIKSYDYMQFYMDSSDCQPIQRLHAGVYLAPSQLAPAIPNRSRSVGITVPDSRYPEHIMECKDEDENDYQSIIHYELIL